MSQPLLTTIKVLFAKSRNTCAFPNCGVPIVELSGTVTGEICHIRAEKSLGPRHIEAYPSELLNATENLILLCGRHHKIIDTETTTYTTDTLMQIKQQHEERGVIEISPQIAKAAAALLAKHESIVITNTRTTEGMLQSTVPELFWPKLSISKQPSQSLLCQPRMDQLVPRNRSRRIASTWSQGTTNFKKQTSLARLPISTWRFRGL